MFTFFRLRRVLLGCGLVASATQLDAQNCTGSVLVGAGGQVAAVPQNADTVFLRSADGSSAAEGPLKNGSWTPTATDLANIASLTAAQKHPDVVFVVKATGTSCVRRILATADAAEGGGASTAAGGAGAQQQGPTLDIAAALAACSQEGQRWIDSLENVARGELGRTVMLFLDTGDGGLTLCRRNRDYGVTGDPIHVGIFTNDANRWRDVRFDPCDIESAENKVFQGAEQFPSGLQASGFTRIQFEPVRCYNTSVDITMTGKRDEAAVSKTVRLGQAQRYRATVQLGGLFTSSHDGDYALRRDIDDSVRIFNKGPTGVGTEYFASIVFYSVLRYLPTLLGGGPYPGRDIIHDTQPADRIGMLLGVGLREPGRRFVVGGTFEVLPGVNAFGGWDFARVRRLSGYEEGDVYLQSQETIPTTEKWRTRFVGGVSLDLLYATRLFKR